MDLNALFKVSYGLYIVSSNYDGVDSACVINTFSQVTAKPAKVCITINKDNFTTKVINDSWVFNCAVLLDEVNMNTIARFGFQSSKDVNKFDGIEYETDVHMVKQIKDEIAATYSCKVLDTFDVGTHLMIVGEIIDCKTVSDKPVLTYENYHHKKNGTTPKNSPLYVEENNKSGYRCSVCGFILEDDVLPADYICPICSNPAEVFNKI